jgi:hypothetical protein
VVWLQARLKPQTRSHPQELDHETEDDNSMGPGQPERREAGR